MINILKGDLAGSRRGRILGRADDTVGNPHRAQISQFEFFELIPLSRLDKQLSVEQFEATASQSTAPSPPPRSRAETRSPDGLEQARRLLSRPRLRTSKILYTARCLLLLGNTDPKPRREHVDEQKRSLACGQADPHLHAADPQFCVWEWVRFARSLPNLSRPSHPPEQGISVIYLCPTSRNSYPTS